MAIPAHLARKKERIAKRNARILYSQKKNDKFVVSSERIPAELKKRKVKGQIRPWSDLPSEIIISEVISRLSSFDEIRLGAVCKNWGKLLIPPIHEVENRRRRTISDDLPWLLSYHWKDDGVWFKDPLVLVCKLFDSSHPKPYSVDLVIGQDICRYHAADILASKHGWLILSWDKPSTSKFLMSYFLFSPLTKQIITLPDLDGQSYCRPHRVTFSTSDPCSSDCVFFVLRDYYCGPILLSTCLSRDTSWTTTQAFEAQPAPVEQVVFAGGFLYCLFYNGALAAFSVANRNWTTLVTTSSNLGGLSPGRCHLFECDGQLLFGYLDGHTLRGLDNGQCHLFSFSQSQRAWVAETSFLANQALFLDLTSSFSVSASGETTNKVYYHATDGTLRFYSFDDGKNHALEGSPYAGWLAAKGWNQKKGIWIQPPQLCANPELKS